MRLGIHLVRYAVPGGTGRTADIPLLLSDVGRACDESGVDVLSLMDHYFQLPYVGGPEEPMLEGYTTLGFLAGRTERVQLQLLVTGVTYRHPGLLAKIGATVDVLSAGRFILGMGAAWFEREHRALGVPFPPLRDRFELLDEALQVIDQMWSDDDGPFEGKHFQLAETICSPRPTRKPPVMVGGVGERKTLRLVAKHADACNFFAGGEQGVDFVAGKLAVLRDHCDREGTDYDAIRKTIMWGGPVDPGDPTGFLRDMEEMAAVGVEEVHLVPPEQAVAFVRGLADVVPRLREV